MRTAASTNPGRLAPVLLVAGLLLRCSGGDESAPSSARPAEDRSAALTGRVVAGTCSGRGEDTEVAAGGAVETTATERAKVELSDGSVVVLDRATKLVLEGGRRVRLEKGRAVLDLAGEEGSPPIVVSLPGSGGSLEATGAKMGLRADAERTLVDVSRGEVKVTSEQGEDVVRPGEQGVVEKGRGPKVEASPDLGRAIAWAEAGETEDDAGTGSLRARNPQAPGGGEQPLRLAEHRMKIRISGPIARTEVEQTFANDMDSDLEGTYRFPVPANARISSLAVEVDGAWREGRFVDRETGERIWRGVQKNARMGGGLGRVDTTEILFAPGPWRDPAILAWEAGNRFSIRIHPIKRRSSRKVRIAWTETLPRTAEGRRYVYPLPQHQWQSVSRAIADRIVVDARVLGHDARKGLHVEGLDLQAADEGGEKVLTHESGSFVPTGNLVIETVEAEPAPVRVASHRLDGDLHAVFAIRPELPRASAFHPLEQVILVDSSHSATGETWRREVAVVRALVREMDPKDRVTVLACDVGCRPVGEAGQKASKELADSLAEALSRIEPAGTSDILRAITEGAALHGTAAGAGRRLGVTYVGDGVATVGMRDPARIAEFAARKATEAFASVSSIAVGTTSDDRTLGEIARRTGGVAVSFAPGDTAISLALRLLGHLRTESLVEASVTLPEGAEDVAPASIPALHAGQETWIAARYTGATSGDVVVRGKLGGRPFESRHRIEVPDPGESGANAFVPAMWAERRVVDLAAEGDQNREAVVELGTRFGLVTPWTSLIVLDTDALAERLGLGERTAPVQWTGDEEVDVRASAGRGARAGAEEAVRAIFGEEAAGSGMAARAGGSGRGASIADVGVVGGGMARRAITPTVRTSTPAVQGAYESATLQRTLRRYTNQFKYCYERELQRNPDLEGRVVVQFRIEPSGAVSMAQVTTSTIGNSNVENCVVSFVRRAAFPAPTGGAVTVTFPLVFASGGGGSSPAQRPAMQSRSGDIQVARPEQQGLAKAPEWVRKGVETLREKVASEPDRREHHRKLARILARLGEVEAGTEAVRKWLERDPMDPEALEILSDMLARSGHRDEAIRVLASVVEVQPGETVWQERLARLYERAGRRDDACAHREALASLSPSDDDAAVLGIRCRESQEDLPADEIRGEIVLDATFEGADLDVQVVFKNGTRVSWMGGWRNARATDAVSTSGEKLALGYVPDGVYTVEIARATPGAGAQVEGSVEVKVLGERRRVPFRLEGARVPVATFTLSPGGTGRLDPWDRLRGLGGLVER